MIILDPMSYAEYLPSDPLKPFVDAYWVRKTPARKGIRRVYADGCADLILYMGASTACFSPRAKPENAIQLKPGVIYLGGTMTEYGLMETGPETVLTGIRFKPGGLYTLFRVSMEAAVDCMVEFPEVGLMERMSTGKDLDAYLEQKIAKPKHDFSDIYDKIAGLEGPPSVEELARRCHLSRRTLERIFKMNVGIAPKQYIQIARFQQVVKMLKNAPTGESLLRMAYDMGYHDHAHLTNEFKRYAGILPSELSRFYKTGITRGQYF